MDSKKETNTTTNDYEFCAVPEDKRKSYASLTIVWTGYVFVITSMMAGGGLAAGLKFSDILLVCILGNIFLGIIATLVSIISSKNGLSFALLTKYSFGVNGSRIASFFVPFVNLGWYIIQAATYGHFIALIFDFGPFGEGICMILSAILMGVFAFAGIKAISVLGYVSIPAIVFLSIATSTRAINMSGGLESIFSYTPSTVMAISTGVTAIIGTWILSSATCIADIMRYARSTKEAILSALTGLLLGNSLMIICGALAAIAVNNSDLPAVLLSMGLLIPSIILMTTNIFTTNAANLYSNSLNLSNSFNMDRKKMIIILLIIAALATLTRPYEIGFFFTFLETLGNVIPPLAGIIIADYFILNKGRYESLETVKFKKWNINAFLTWAISLVLSFVIPFGLPALTSLISSIIIFPILSIVFGNKKIKGGASYEEV
ncbi:cytosine permease [Clostridium sp. D53t1_180928_C8]|uniref:cytosine permease n=1 Tax=Clostridium sp. D53t1_180928_C8 TaxID=2787101 RepID=UPI0018ABD907